MDIKEVFKKFSNKDAGVISRYFARKAIRQLNLIIDDQTFNRIFDKHSFFSNQHHDTCIKIQNYACIYAEVNEELQKRKMTEYLKNKQTQQEIEKKKLQQFQKEEAKRKILEEKEKLKQKQMQNLTGIWKQQVLFGQKEWGVHDIRITQDGKKLKAEVMKTMVQGKYIPIQPDFGIGCVDDLFVTLKFTRKNSAYTSQHNMKIIQQGKMEGTWTSNANQKGNSRWEML